MASRRYRSQRTAAGQVDHLVKRLSYIEKRPTPKKLLARVVTTAKISPAAVTAPKLADNAVTSNAIAPEAVTNAELAANAVTSYNIVPGSIMASDVGFTASDIGANASLYSDEPPTTASAGDLWFDSNNGNLLSRYDGTHWIPVRDLAIAAANTAAAAANTAAQAANVAANAAQTTANSKNRVIRATTDATGTSDAVGAFKSGDIWWKMDSVAAAANVVGQWTFDGTKWNVNTIGNTVIANLDAAKITTGYLAAGRIQANSIDASVLVAGSITAGQIAANAITAGKIAANSITAGAIAANAVTATTIDAAALTGKTITGGVLQTSAATGVNKVVIDSALSDRIQFFCANSSSPGFIEVINADVNTGSSGAGLYIYAPNFNTGNGLTGRPYIQLLNAPSQSSGGTGSTMRFVADSISFGPINYGIYPITVSIGGSLTISTGGDAAAVSTTTVGSQYISVGTGFSGDAGPVYAGSVPSSTKGYRAITYSTSAATGGYDGDMWLIYV
jgi:hypothetical protein